MLYICYVTVTGSGPNTQIFQCFHAPTHAYPHARTNDNKYICTSKDTRIFKHLL